MLTWKDFGKNILNRCVSLHGCLLNGLVHFQTRLMVLKIPKQKVLMANVRYISFLPKLGTAFPCVYSKSHCWTPRLLTLKWHQPFHESVTQRPWTQVGWFWVVASQGKKCCTHHFSSISFATLNVCSRWYLKLTLILLFESSLKQNPEEVEVLCLPVHCRAGTAPLLPCRWHTSLVLWGGQWR